MPTGAATATSGTRRITSPSICAWSSAPLRSASSRSQERARTAWTTSWHARTIPAKCYASSSTGPTAKRARASSTSCPQLLRRARQLLPLDLVNFIDEGWPLALTQELSIAVYRDGRYWNGESKKFNSITPGSARQRLHAATTGNSRVRSDRALLRQRRAHPREPRRAPGQLPQRPPRPADPGAAPARPRDPHHEADQRRLGPKRHGTDLRGLDRGVPTGTNRSARRGRGDDARRDPHPRKAMFLYGPSRSGKSTYLRLLRAIVGPRDTSRSHFTSSPRTSSPAPTSTASASTSPPTSAAVRSPTCRSSRCSRARTTSAPIRSTALSSPSATPRSSPSQLTRSQP